MKDKKNVDRIPEQSQEMKEALEGLDAMAKAAEAGDKEAEQILRDVTDQAKKALADIKADARQKRELGRSNRAAISDALSALHRLEEVSDCKSHLQEATTGLFRIIEEAQNSLLKLTGAPGIISQTELEMFRTECDSWGERPFVERMSVHRAPFRDLGDRLNERFDAGWIIEPGRWGMKLDHEVYAIGEFGRKAPRAPRAPRPARTDTPTPEQLQAWFDLPSDRPSAESSPAAS